MIIPSAVSHAASNGTVNAGGAGIFSELAHAMEVNPVNIPLNTSTIRSRRDVQNREAVERWSILRKVGIQFSRRLALAVG